MERDEEISALFGQRIGFRGNYRERSGMRGCSEPFRTRCKSMDTFETAGHICLWKVYIIQPRPTRPGEEQQAEEEETEISEPAIAKKDARLASALALPFVSCRPSSL